MAKSRAQRKAERRAREAAKKSGSAGSGRAAEKARQDTQVPKSGDVAEVEAVEAGIAAGAPEELLEVPDAPAPRKKSRAETRAEKKRRREAEKRQLAERERREREKLAKSKEKAPPGQRTGVIGFLVSCWAELKKVQWPNRDTLIQATIVTIVFVVIAAAYLGALDLIFSEVMKQIL